MVFKIGELIKKHKSNATIRGEIEFMAASYELFVLNNFVSSNNICCEFTSSPLLAEFNIALNVTNDSGKSIIFSTYDAMQRVSEECIVFCDNNMNVTSNRMLFRFGLDPLKAEIEKSFIKRIVEEL